jgi:hypothetical protein
MLTVPVTRMGVIGKCAPVCSQRGWEHARVVVVGAGLAPGKRTVTAILRVMGLSEAAHLQNSHRVLNRARGSGLVGARGLVGRWVSPCVPVGLVVSGLDDPLERRRGAKLPAKGSSRAPGRSARAPVVQARG